MKKIILLTIALLIFSTAFTEEIRNDIIQINYQKKSLAKAMVLSSLFPGAGQFYANRRSITTYIFPILELGLIAGYIINYNDGADIESDYEKFADQYYSREHQHFAEHDLINDTMNNSQFYDDHFRLDDENTQHFYEDIGKYNKYVFGWDDWFDIYATDTNGNTVSPDWIWEETTSGKNLWIGNNVTNPESDYYNSNYSDPYNIYSDYRNEYIQLRKSAEKSYYKSSMFSFGIVANHILSAIDAVRLTTKHNREYISNNSQLEIKFAPIFANNTFSPGIMLTKRF
ncbi:MAG: hypothetical protein K9N07_09690 [Candidatus Cloacimonetes bacterium]|nr:hypothetical protein [Candidatus Cloacimonadota bacterium]